MRLLYLHMRISLCLLIAGFALCGAGCTGAVPPAVGTNSNTIATSTSATVAAVTTSTFSYLDRELPSRAYIDQWINVTSTGLSIEVQYPHLVSGGTNAFDAMMDAKVRAVVNQFKSDFADARKMAKTSTDPTVGPTDADPWTLRLSFQTDSYGDYTKSGGTHLVSILVSGSEYTQGAHSNPVYLAVTYDLNTRKELKLADLFKPGTPYLQEISDAALAQLMKRHETENFSDTNWIKGGAGPEERNFQFFAVTPDGVKVYFPQTQVASFADGAQSVFIPFSQLKGWKL